MIPPQHSSNDSACSSTISKGIIRFFRPQRVVVAGWRWQASAYVPPFSSSTAELPEHGGIDWPIDFQISSQCRK